MPNWFKLATGWLLTVLVALAFSWGAIAQVRNRVDMPGTVIPTRVVVKGLEVSQETPAPAPATTTSTVQAIGVDPEIELLADTITKTGDVAADAPDDGAATTSQSESTGTTSASTPASSGSTPTTRPDSSGSAASAVPESSGTTSTTSADGTSAPTTTGTSVTTTTEASVTTTTQAPVTTTTEPSPADDDPPPDDDDPPPADEPVTQKSTYNLVGGTLTITYSSGVVNLVGTSPIFGYGAEIEKSGPSEVKVKFESDDHVSEFTAKWEDGKLDIEIDENPKDDDGDGDD